MLPLFPPPRLPDPVLVRRSFAARADGGARPTGTTPGKSPALGPAPVFALTAALALVVGPSLGPVHAAFPLETSPSYESNPNGQVATGGGFADLDGDGWLDMVVANGNDISRQRVAVYHNNGDGTFPASPTWESSDIDYHGHLDLGDVNGDGFTDVVVSVYIGAGGFATPGRAKLYLGDGAGAFEPTPAWISPSFYTFSSALGDVDGDGDLDLACATGDDYYDHAERQKIFFNIGGTFEATPSWESDEIDYALDVFWQDVDDDGDLDVAFCGTSSPVRVYLNAQTEGGGLATTAGWENLDSPQFGNTTAFGDWNGDGFPELAVADNNQLGGDGTFKVYANADGTLGTNPSWESAAGGYGSHVSWVDLDTDGDLDLVGGGWWEPSRIFENVGADLTTTPVWTSATTSVIENIFWGDVDNDALFANGASRALGDGTRTFFAVGQAPVRSIDAVLIDGAPLGPSEYCDHLGNGWISLSTPPAPGEEVLIQFSYSADLDCGVTNWDGSVGNYVHYNLRTPASTPTPSDALSALRAFPNPVPVRTRIRYQGPDLSAARLEIFDATGRRLTTLHEGAVEDGLRIWEWDRTDRWGRAVPGGVYFARLASNEGERVLRLVAID